MPVCQGIPYKNSRRRLALVPCQSTGSHEVYEFTNRMIGSGDIARRRRKAESEDKHDQQGRSDYSALEQPLKSPIVRRKWSIGNAIASPFGSAHTNIAYDHPDGAEGEQENPPRKSEVDDYVRPE